MMRKIELKELKELQMQILDYVDEFCNKRNIIYSLAAGTLLGAIRHQGYIPWDDDIDIQLTRDEYERFITLWNKEEHPFVLHVPNSGDPIGVPFGKISNPRTRIKEPGMSTIGINIDVIPIDKVINTEDFKMRHSKILQLYVSVWRKNRKWSWKPNVIFWKCIGLLRSPKSDLLRINEIAKAKNNEETEFLFEMIAGRTIHSPWSAKAFCKTIDVSFENRTYKAFIGYDEYLTAAYGNYMQLPPKEKQITHHRFEAWWKD